MISRHQHANGLRKGILIDYDYALDINKQLRQQTLSPSSPVVWLRLLQKAGGDPNYYLSLQQLGEKERALQQHILSLLEAGKRLCGHRTVHLICYRTSVIFSRAHMPS